MAEATTGEQKPTLQTCLDAAEKYLQELRTVSDSYQRLKADLAKAGEGGPVVPTDVTLMLMVAGRPIKPVPLPTDPTVLTEHLTTALVDLGEQVMNTWAALHETTGKAKQHCDAAKASAEAQAQ